MLKFLGRGSAFNTKEGNNSAYYKSGESILLIDCGCTVFSEIQKRNILDGIKYVYVAITHTHTDHCGSLPDLILYCYYVLKIDVVVIHPENFKIKTFLNIAGVDNSMYQSLESTEIEIRNIDFNIQITFEEIRHVSEMRAYCLFLEIEDKTIFYSGDTNMINRDLLYDLELDIINYFYQDTSSVDYEGNVHLSFKRLKELIKPKVRSKVYCMHLDGQLSDEEIEAEGFNVVKIN